MFAAGNLADRVLRRLRRSAAHARHRAGLPALELGAATLAPAFRHPIDANQRRKLAARYQALFPDAAVKEVAEAQRLMRHEFSLLGHDAAHEVQIAWSRDPVSGRCWSREFSPDIPYRGPARLGDIKLPWELNKHQYFATLGKSAWLTDDPAFAVEIVREIDHWIEDNPFFRGINWISALETGMRAIAWIMAYPFYADHCDAAFRRRLARSLALHMRFVEAHLSMGPFTNTHIVGEAAALVIGGLFLEDRRSRAWLEKGLAILADEMNRQMTADGVHVERSVAYHRFFLDHYYLVSRVLSANGRQLPARTLRQMEKMTAFLMDVVFSDGSAPAFGDGDDARGLWLRADCPTDYRSLLALGAVLFERGDFKATAGALPEEILWLLGDEGVERFLTLPARLPDHNSAAFPDGGYYVMRGGWGPSDPVLILDCGPLGHGPAGHGHADALSFQLWAGEYPFLVDAGTFSYNLDYAWRDVFRSTKAHNTLVVDDDNQSVPGDRMSWKSMAVAVSRRWVTTRWFDLADGEHDGYRRYVDPVAHRRVVIFVRPDTWWICDRLDSSGHHEFEALLHLLPGCSVQQLAEPPGVVLQAPNGSTLRARLFADGGEAIAPDVLVGSEEKRSAWFSPSYGVRLPARALSVRRQFVGRATLVTSVTSSTGKLPTVLEQDCSLRVAVQSEAGDEDVVFYRVDSDWPPETDGIRFDGQLLYRRKISGRSAVVWATGFRDLSVAGLFAVRSAVPVDSLVLEDGRCEVVLSPDHVSGLRVTTAGHVEVLVNGCPAS